VEHHRVRTASSLHLHFAGDATSGRNYDCACRMHTQRPGPATQVWVMDGGILMRESDGAKARSWLRQWTMVALAAWIAISIAGCGPFDRPSGPVSRGDAIGTYRVRYEPYRGVYLGKETLVLRPDTTYEQIFTPATGRVARNTGTWTFSQASAGPEIYLDGLMHYLDESYDHLAKPPKRLGMFTGVAKHGKHVSILINDDLGLWYEKVK